MRKTGKEIQCKTCRKSFYVAKWEILANRMYGRNSNYKLNYSLPLT